MEFSTAINNINSSYNLNAIDEYNKYLQGHASFEVENNVFEEALDKAAKSYSKHTCNSKSNSGKKYL